MKFIPGNHIALLKNGAAFFPALESAIDTAITDIRLETYIFHADSAGTRVAEALIRAANRGVNVQVLIDGFGSRTTLPQFFKQMQAAGVRFDSFVPVHTLFDFRRHRVRRMHRKIVLIDGRTGFVGGINIIDDFTESLSQTHPRFDYAVKIDGPILADIYPSVQQLWQAVQRFNPKRCRSKYVPPAVSPAATGAAALAFVVRDNFRHRRDIERAYQRAIAGATKDVLIVNSYFLPGRRLRNVLMAASRRGVVVTILLQGLADHPLMQMASRALYDKLLAAGILIYEYQPAMLHGKVAVVDGVWSTVGSSNLDPFSLLLNREANVVVQDAEFADSLRVSVMDEIARNATQLNFARWQQRSVWLRMKSWLALGLARLVTGFMGEKHE